MTLVGVSFLGINQYQGFSNTGSLNANINSYLEPQNSGLNGLGDPYEAFNSAMSIINEETSGYNSNNSQMNTLSSLDNFMSVILAMLSQVMGSGQQINSYDNATNNSYGYTTPGNSYLSGMNDLLSGLNTSSSSNSLNLNSQSWVSGIINNLGLGVSNIVGNAGTSLSNFLGNVGQGVLNLGKNIANVANSVATNMNTSGYCYRGVKKALSQFGINLTGGSAYMAADQLSNNSKFQEVSVSKDELKNLPAGAVVVWNKGNGHEHGHISIALGNGKEASDKLRNQIVNYGTSFRVFMPKA